MLFITYPFSLRPPLVNSRSRIRFNVTVIIKGILSFGHLWSIRGRELKTYDRMNLFILFILFIYYGDFLEGEKKNFFTFQKVTVINKSHRNNDLFTLIFIFYLIYFSLDMTSI